METCAALGTKTCGNSDPNNWCNLSEQNCNSCSSGNAAYIEEGSCIVAAAFLNGETAQITGMDAVFQELVRIRVVGISVRETVLLAICSTTN